MIKLIDLYNYLSIPQNVINKLDNIKMSEKEFQKLSYFFYKDEEKFFSKLNKNYQKNYLIYLYLYLRFSLNLYKNYLEHHIDLNIYFDTIDDIRIWCLELLEKTNIYGLEEIYWINEHLHMRLFKLGRLQFQRKAVDENDRIMIPCITEDIKYIYNVHIPKGESLSEEEINKSFKYAYDFYKDKMIFTCDSWLLSPNLQKVLESNSNILKFSNRFTVVNSDFTSDSIYRYVKRGSKLYNKIVEFETKYQKIGTAYGYFVYKV